MLISFLGALRKLFARLSGEHPTLPYAEAKAILEAEFIPFKVLEETPCLLRFEASSRALKALAERAAYCKACGFELFTCQTVEGEILRKMEEVPFERLVGEGESFAVRIRRVCGAPVNLDVPRLEAKLGAAIWRKVENPKVNPSSPDRLFLGLLLPDGRFLFSLCEAEIPSKSFSERKPTRKPFSHPSTLQPKLARCMVNLARARRGGILLDPFCGTGSILLEASLIGVEALGGDLQPRMVHGAKLNVEYFHAEGVHLFVADAAKPPLQKVDFIATDPPYGRSATTGGKPLLSLLESFLTAASELLSKDGWLCMASPAGVEVEELAGKLGFKLVESHAIHVHKSLTRLVLVFKP